VPTGWQVLAHYRATVRFATRHLHFNLHVSAAPSLPGNPPGTGRIRHDEDAAFSTGSQIMSRAPRSLVAVSGHPQRAELLDALLIDADDYDVIFLEPIARGYSRIKQVIPDLVIVSLEIDDVGACQLLSMLKIDSDTSAIPVVTWATRNEESELEDIIADVNGDSSSQTIAVQMN
jgi:PleD family two-component response regulator